jgi:uncharacterized membrane protein
MTVSVLVFAGLSVGAYLHLSRWRTRTGRTDEHSVAERRLAEQFARGQIDEQEYRHLAAVLSEARPLRRRSGVPRRGPRRR